MSFAAFQEGEIVPFCVVTLSGESVSSGNAQSAWFRQMPAKLATKPTMTSETPQPPQTPSGRPSTRRMGFLKGIRTQPPGCRFGGSSFDRLLQHVVEITLGGVAASPFRTERRPLLHISEGREQRSVQFLRAGPFRLGFDNELVVFFPDRAFRGQ